eukprot:6635215-Prymnesium_polylepis.2
MSGGRIAIARLNRAAFASMNARRRRRALARNTGAECAISWNNQLKCEYVTGNGRVNDGGQSPPPSGTY